MTEAARALEAILMVAPEPVETHLLAQLLEVSQEQVEAAAADLQAGYDAEGRGFMIAQVAGGYRFQSHPDLAPYVERFVLEGQSARLSSAALETLAIVAYKQPLSRAQIAAIRGVNVDGVMRTLQQRGYIEEVGRDPGPGQAVLFGTTRRVPRPPRARHDRRPAAGRRPHARRRRGRGARAGPPGRAAHAPTADHEARRRGPRRRGRRTPSRSRPTAEPVVGDPQPPSTSIRRRPEAIEEPAWMREPAPAGPESSDVDVHDTSDPSDAPSSTSVE